LIHPRAPSAERDFLTGLANRLDPRPPEEIPWSPEGVIILRPAQRTVFGSSARFRVIVAGRRWGKTYLALILLLEIAMKFPGCDVWYTAPNYRQAKRVAWRKFKRLLPRHLIARSHESELFFDLRNGSRITLVGRENPDSLRGEGLRRIVNDEFASNERGDKGKETWDAVLRPMLSDLRGDAVFISTPRGFNWGYDFYLRGQDDEWADWHSWQMTTLQGGNVAQEEVDDARREMDAELFAQEYEASFQKLKGLIYKTFDANLHLDNDIELPDDVEILVGQDFNVEPMAAVLAYRNPHNSEECLVFDSLELGDSNTQEMADALTQRFPDRKLVSCPDPTGKSRKTSADRGVTDFTLLRDAGFEIRAPSKAPPVIDRENNTKAMLRSAAGDIRVRIHPRAKRLIRGLQGLRYKEGTRLRDKSASPPLDHICDAFDYLLWQEFNILARREAVVEQFRR